MYIVPLAPLIFRFAFCSLTCALCVDWGGTSAVPLTPESTVIYELHIPSFNSPTGNTDGTFATAIEKLPFLKAGGVLCGGVHQSGRCLFVAAASVRAYQIVGLGFDDWIFFFWF